MLESLARLQTWKFWSLLVAIFAPIWGATIVFCIVAFHAKTISVSTPMIGLTTIAEQLTTISDVNRQQRDELASAQNALLRSIDEASKLSIVSNATSASSLESNFSKTNFMQLKDSVSKIKLIPEDRFDEINKNLENLKKIYLKQ